MDTDNSEKEIYEEYEKFDTDDFESIQNEEQTILQLGKADQ